MQAKLFVVEPDLQPNQYDLTLPMTIGRSRDSRLKLMHALVSRRHCELFEDGGTLMVRDLGSLNGTFVGGERVETAALPPGGLLTIGSVTFRAVYGEDATLAPVVAASAEADTTADTLRLEETTDAEAFRPPAEQTAAWEFEDKEEPPLSLKDDTVEELPLTDAMKETSDEISLADTEIPPLKLVDEDSLPLELPEVEPSHQIDIKPTEAENDSDLDSWFDSLELEDESEKPKE